MNAFAQIYGALLPLRWYEAVLFDQAARGMPVQASAGAFAGLAALAVVYTLLALYRLRAMQLVARPGPTEVEAPQLAPVRSGIVGSLAAEWRRVLGNRAAFGLLVLAPVIYGVFYPQPYLTQILRDIPIAVVDNDLSDLSRQVVEALDASGTVKVAMRTETLEEARRSLDRARSSPSLAFRPTRSAMS